MLRRSVAALSLVIVTLVCAPATAALAANGPSVAGAGTTSFGATEQHVSVHAFDTSGHAVFRLEGVVQDIHGRIDINCVLIVGNHATLSGIVTRSSDPGLEGFAALFQVRDNGQGQAATGPDTMSPILLFEVGIGPNCLVPAEFDHFPVRGNFRVESD
jgi:hypothetical protein